METKTETKNHFQGFINLPPEDKKGIRYLFLENIKRQPEDNKQKIDFPDYQEKIAEIISKEQPISKQVHDHTKSILGKHNYEWSFLAVNFRQDLTKQNFEKACRDKAVSDILIRGNTETIKFLVENKIITSFAKFEKASQDEAVSDILKHGKAETIKFLVENNIITSFAEFEKACRDKAVSDILKHGKAETIKFLVEDKKWITSFAEFKKVCRDENILYLNINKKGFKGYLQERKSLQELSPQDSESMKTFWQNELQKKDWYLSILEFQESDLNNLKKLFLSPKNLATFSYPRPLALQPHLTHDSLKNRAHREEKNETYISSYTTAEDKKVNFSQQILISRVFSPFLPLAPIFWYKNTNYKKAVSADVQTYFKKFNFPSEFTLPIKEVLMYIYQILALDDDHYYHNYDNEYNIYDVDFSLAFKEVNNLNEIYREIYENFSYNEFSKDEKKLTTEAFRFFREYVYRLADYNLQRLEKGRKERVENEKIFWKNLKKNALILSEHLLITK